MVNAKKKNTSGTFDPTDPGSTCLDESRWNGKPILFYSISSCGYNDATQVVNQPVSVEQGNGADIRSSPKSGKNRSFTCGKSMS